MSKNILISIKPQYCNMIFAGEKTLEIRKNKPLCGFPVRVFVYCSEANTKDPNKVLETHSNGKIYRCNGKVMGEFVCDGVVRNNPSIKGEKRDFSNLADACLSDDELFAHSGYRALYGWHVSDVTLYDKPKDLSEFCNMTGKTLKLPPQSWSYVESKVLPADQEQS